MAIAVVRLLSDSRSGHVVLQDRHKQTGEIAVDRESGAKMMTVGLTIADEGEANLYTVSIPETGVPEGITLGMPVKVVGLKARDWENTFNGEKRFGIAFRAVALVGPSAKG
ncbi:SCO3933 family regulatory protein [Streptomyces sp. NPDC055287]